MIYPLPYGMNFKEWASQIKNTPTGLNIPNPFPQDQWWEWVSALIQLNPQGNIPVPNKIIYPKVEDWKIWAQFFLNNLNAS